jgi:hypothetical protein
MQGALTLIVHWNGSAWRQVKSPSPTGAAEVNVLDAVAGRSASDIWATGFSIRKFPDAETTVALHWNGKTWTHVRTPHPAEGNGDSIAGVAAPAAGTAWHSEDVPGMLRQLGLEPPPAVMRFAARRSARRYKPAHA